MLCKETIRESARESRKACSDYIQERLERYEIRERFRRKRGIKVIAFLGHGRSGKDESAKIFARLTGAMYGRSTSDIVSPIIARSLGVSQEFAFNHRHFDRMYWKEWCDALRENDPTLICKMLLAEGDILVGIRGKPEFYSMMADRVADTAVWVKRNVPKDPTMDYSWTDLTHFPDRYRLVDNMSTLADLENRLRDLARDLKMLKGE